MSRRLRSAILWGAGLLAAAALAALAVLSIAIHRVVTPDLVAERASAALGREVSVGAVGLSLQPMLRIRLQRVSIAPDITLEKADLALRISSLLERRIEVAFVEVEDASLTLVRRADGGIELYGATHEEGEKARESGGDSEPGAAPASLALPGIELRRVAIAFEDRAVADPPLRIPFRVERLELEPVAAGARPSLSVAAAVGEHGEGGRLSLEAEVGPLEAEEPIDQHPFRARLELRSVNPAPFVPYLPSRLDAHRLEGVLEGSIAVEGRARGDLTADLALSLVEGGADLAGVGLSSPRYEGRVRRTDGSFRVEEARLQAPLVEFGEHRLRGVRAAFGFAEGTVELESLELDSLSGSWRPAGTATPGEGRAADLELHVQRTGPVALRGRLRLPSGTGEPGGRRLDVELPEVEVRDAEVEVVDRARPALPPARLRVDRLRLRDLAEGEVASCSLAARLGQGGRAGSLSLDGELGPLAWERPLAELPFALELAVGEMDPKWVASYVPERWRPSRIEGLLTAKIDAEGPARSGSAQIDVALEGGGIEIAGVELAGRTTFAGRIRRAGDALGVEAGRLTAEGLSFGGRRGEALRAGFGLANGTVELESLELDSLSGSWRPAGTATPGEGRAADLELHVQRTGPVALRGRLRLPSGTGEPGGRRLDVELPEVEVRDAEVEVVDRARPALPPARLRVDRLSLRDLAEGEVASCSLAARLGQGGRAGSLSLDGELGPLAWERPLAELPFALELAVGEMDPKWVASYVPERWRPSRIEGLLTAKIDAEGPARSGSAQIDVALEGGGIEIAGVELAGRTTFAGRIRRAGDALGVEAGRLTAEGLSFGGRRGEALRAGFGLANGTVEIEFLDLRAYDGTLHQAGRLVLGQVPEFDLRVEAAGVDARRLLGVAVEGAGPTLLEGEATVRGRWTGQPNWLEPVRGEGRVLLRGGVLPSQDLLIAVSRALLSLVPGSPTLLRERPRLARLERMTATFRAETGRVRTDDLRVWTDDFQVSGRGSVGHGGDLDCRLEVVLTGRGVGKAFVLALTNQQLRDAAKLPAVPVRVKGPAGSPSFQADVSSVPVALLRGVLGIPGRAGAAALGVVGTGRDAAGAVGGGVNRTVRRLRGGRERAEPTPDALP